ncbi:hypothetical protein Tco_0442233 [Tanacetum coccineum]
MRKSWREEYNRNLMLEAELSKINELSKTCSRLQNHCILLELKLHQYKKSFQNNKSYSNLDAPALNEFFVINNLKAQLQAKESSISKLRAHIATFKGKNVSDNNEPANNASVIAPRMFRLNLEPVSHRLKNNREAHDDNLKQTRNILTHYELLVYVSETCPSFQVKRKKLVAVTPMNKTRMIRSQEPKESSRVIPSTSASGSQSKNNTRKNRITTAASSNKKNKTVEVNPRKVMSSSNKRNHVSMCNANVKHAVKDANSKFVCSACNGCLFYANHDKCVFTYINDVNKRVKFKSGKSKKMEWKPTGKVFTSVGHRWLPTERTFTINGTKCPLTRITSNPIVPPKKTSKTLVITPNLKVKVYRRRTKVAKSVIRYGDYQIGNVIISQVYYVDGLGHNLFSVGSSDTNLYILSLADMMRSSPICLLSKASKTKSWLWHRSKRHNKAPYELLHDRKPDLKYLHVFGALCYLKNDSEDLVVAPELTETPSSTSIDQDEPSPSTSQTPQELQSLLIPSSVEEKFHDIEVAHLDIDPIFGVPIP